MPRPDQEEFDAKLHEIVDNLVDQIGVEAILVIPGVSEILGNHFQNQICLELGGDAQDAADHAREERHEHKHLH